MIEDIGFKPVVGANVLKMHGYMAGSDSERLEDLVKFIEDDSIRGIFCVTGGFGSLHLLQHLPYTTIQKQPKVLVGCDDNTSWLAAISARTGLVTFQGPNLDEIRTKYTLDRLKLALTSNKALPVISAGDTVGDDIVSSVYAPVKWTVEGPLLGGNLTALMSLMGTPFEPMFDGRVLFLEDRDERNDILDRWFTTLWVSGQLQRTAGVCFGSFEGCGTRDSYNMLSLEDLFGDRLKLLNKPCCFGLPLGQGKDTSTVAVGVKVRLDTAQGKLEFLEPALV